MKKKAAPIITTCLAIAGTLATVYFSAKGGIKSAKTLEYSEDIKGKKLNPIEKVQMTWKNYIPAASCAGVTIATIVTGHIVNRRIQTSLVGAYAMIDQTYRRYQDQVKKLYGNEAHVKVLQNMPKEAEKVNITSECLGQVCSLDFGVDEEKRTFYDAFSGTYFTSTIGRVMEAEHVLNRNYILGWEIKLSDWYSFLGIDPPKNADANTLGWTNEAGFDWIDFHHYSTSTDDGFECCVIEFAVDPYPLCN